MSAPDTLLGWLAAAIIASAIAILAYSLAVARDSVFHRLYRQNAAELEKQCRLLYLGTTGAEIAKKQALVAGALLLGALFLREFLFVAAAVVVLLVPRLYLSSKIDERKQKLDLQLDGFLTTLANALKVSPSLGDALASTANLMRSPIKEDLEYTLKEYQLGTPLDQALMNMSRRVESRSFNSALTTILIGRQTGGDLPKILERSAATLREMARLEGVVRAKTAEGKGQALVLGAVPFVLVLAINFLDPGWLAPLTSGVVGYIIMAVAVLMWLAGIFIARKILNVDI